MRHRLPTRPPRRMALALAMLGLVAAVGAGINVWHAVHWKPPPAAGEIRKAVFADLHLGTTRLAVAEQLRTGPNDETNTPLPARGLACDLYNEYPPDMTAAGELGNYLLCYAGQVLVFKEYIDNNDNCASVQASVQISAPIPPPCRN